LLLVDDFEDALRENKEYTEAEMRTFLYAMRGLALDPRGALSVIVSTFRRLDVQGPKLDIPSPWYNHYLYHALKSYSEDEVKALFAHARLSVKQRDGIREIAGSHPALLQIACQLLFNKQKEGPMTEAGLQQVIDDFRRDADRFFRNTWRLSTQAEQACLMLTALLAVGGRLPGKRGYKLDQVDAWFSQKEREFLDLKARGILRARADNKLPHLFDSSMMELWIIREIENGGEESLRDYESVFGGLMSRRQLEQVKGILKQVWQAKETVNQVVQWAGELVAAFLKGLKG
jgi:hypothetical protein